MKNKKKKSKEILNSYKPDRTNYINSKTLRILPLIREFREDIKKIREDFDIQNPPKNYATPLDAWDEIHQWFQKRNFLTMSRMDDVGNFQSKRNDPFVAEVKRIGEKFNLPYNLYNDAHNGLPYYILTGRFGVIGENWMINPEPVNSDKKPHWFDIRVYQPLTEKDYKKISKELKKQQEHHWGKITTRRPRINEFEKKFPLIIEMLKRTEKPVKKLVSKFAGEEFESVKDKKKFREDMEVIYTEPTARQIAEDSKITPENLRVYKSELNKFAKELFGFDIDP